MFLKKERPEMDFEERKKDIEQEKYLEISIFVKKYWEKDFNGYRCKNLHNSLSLLNILCFFFYFGKFYKKFRST